MNGKFLRLARLPAVAGFICLTWLSQPAAKAETADKQMSFATPEEATNALVKAAKARDRDQMREIFGPEMTNFMTGDRTLDDTHFDSFAARLSERCATAPGENQSVTLQIGKEGWEFPIPLVKTNGVWMFDTMAGEEEIINRHVGEDEYCAIGVCRDYVKAQQQYAERLKSEGKTAHYAMHMKGTPGKDDGLCSAADSSGQSGQLPALVAQACMEGRREAGEKGPHPFHGYFFKILTRQGTQAGGGKMNYVHHGEMRNGFALVAYPIKWGDSGVMTFIVNQDGVVYQKSLGEETARIAEGMREFNPGDGWTVEKEKGITDLQAQNDAGAPSSASQ